MPIEFYQGRPLEPEELESIRQQIEQFDTIEVIDHEMARDRRAQLAAPDPEAPRRRMMIERPSKKASGLRCDCGSNVIGPLWGAVLYQPPS